MHQQRLLARERRLDGTVQQPGRQRGLGLVGAVLLAPEGSAVGDLLGPDAAAVDSKHGRGLVAVVPHSLAAGVQVQAALAVDDLGHGQGRLGLQEGLLHSLGLERLPHDVGRRGQRVLHVAAPGVGRYRQDVAVQAPDRVLGAVGHGRGRVGDRGQRLVDHVEQLRRPAGRLAAVGHHQGHDVAQIRRASALGDEHRPVLVDQPDAQVAWHVGSGEHGRHAGHGLGPAGVDGYHVGPGVLGQVHRAVEHSRRRHVVDVELVAQRQVGGLVAGGARSDAHGRSSTAVPSAPIPSAPVASMSTASRIFR